MIDYDFLERRVYQLENDHNWIQASYMVDTLWDNNFKKFKQGDAIVNDICNDLWHELDETYNPDIPF